MISFVSSSQLETFHRHHHYLSSFSFFSCVSWSSSPVVHRTNHIMHTTIVILLTFSFYPYVFLFFSLSLLSPPPLPLLHHPPSYVSVFLVTKDQSIPLECHVISFCAFHHHYRRWKQCGVCVILVTNIPIFF